MPAMAVDDMVVAVLASTLEVGMEHARLALEQSGGNQCEAIEIIFNSGAGASASSSSNHSTSCSQTRSVRVEERSEKEERAVKRIRVSQGASNGSEVLLVPKEHVDWIHASLESISGNFPNSMPAWQSESDPPGITLQG